jgi:putative transposase
VKISARQHYLWRSVGQNGEVVDGYLQARRYGAAARRCFRRLIRRNHREPRKIATDKPRSYSVADRDLICTD